MEYLEKAAAALFNEVSSFQGVLIKGHIVHSLTTVELCIAVFSQDPSRPCSTVAYIHESVDQRNGPRTHARMAPEPT